MAGSHPPHRLNGHGVPGVRGFAPTPPDGPLFDMPPVAIRCGDTSDGAGLYGVDGRELSDAEADEWQARFKGEAPRAPLPGDLPEVLEYLRRTRPRSCSPPPAPAPTPPPALSPSPELAGGDPAMEALRQARIVADLHQVHDRRRRARSEARWPRRVVVIYGPDERLLRRVVPPDPAAYAAAPAEARRVAARSRKRWMNIPRAWMHVIGLELMLFAVGMWQLGDPLPPYGLAALIGAAACWLPSWMPTLRRPSARHCP